MSAVIDSYHWMDSPSPNRQSAILWWEELRRLKRGDEKGERGSSWGGRGEGGVGVLLVNHFSARAQVHRMMKNIGYHICNYIYVCFDN